MNFFALMKSRTALGGMLMISGCCIGAGMVGLPVVSVLAGFMPSTLAMFLVYIFTTLTGLLLLEATLWFDKRVNLMSITEYSLGKAGKLITMLLFLFLFYCIFVAYLDGGGNLFAGMISSILNMPVSREAGILVCVSLVSVFTYIGAQLVDTANRAMLIGLAFSYFALVVIGLPHMKAANLARIDWTASISTVPILMICFGYQNLVPSLTAYLKRNVEALRFAIIIGNLIPFFVYALWNLVILGMITPQQISTMSSNDLVSEMLQQGSHSAPVIFFVKSFSFFAILTSFLPSAMSFVDFLKDGFKVAHIAKPKYHLSYYAFVFVPPLLFSLVYPHLFLEALSFAGGFIDVLLFGVLPALVVLLGRNKKLKAPYTVSGGIFTPIIVILISVYILFIRLS